MKLLHLLFTLFVCLSSYANTTKISEINGVPVLFEVNDETFPESWKTKEVNATADPLDTAEIERSLRIVKKAFAKYPQEVLKNNLKKIYVLKYIEFFGQPYGGTNSNDVLYIANRGVMSAYTDTFIEQTIHHEFSSILLRNFPNYFDKEKWITFNKQDYGDGGVEALKTSKTSLDFDTAFNQNGFLHQYANSDMENDFNSFAENIFRPETGFYDVVKNYTGIAGKLEVIISFYNSVNKKFTKKYFESIRKSTQKEQKKN